MRRKFLLALLIHVLWMSFLNISASLAQWIPSGPEGGDIVSLNKIGNKLYAIAGESSYSLYVPHDLYFSTDNGDTWVKETNPSLPEMIWDIKECGSSIFLASFSGIYRSDDGGNIWLKKSNGLLYNNEFTWELTVKGNTLFARTVVGLFRSTDNGENWVDINSGLSGYIYSVAANETTIFVGVENGFYRSSDNGDSWESSATGMGYYYYGDFYPDIPPTITSIEINGANQNEIYAGTIENQGIWKSTDNGLNWVHTNANTLNYYHFTSLLSSTDGSVLIAGANTSGILRSVNDGNTWSFTNNGIDVCNGLNSLLSSEGSILVSTNSGIYKSNDNGVTWSKSSNGIKAHLSTFHCFQSIGSSIFVGTTTGGVYRTNNDGANWTSVTDRLPINGGTPLYNLGATSKDLFAYSYFSKDKGDTWNSSNAPGTAGEENTNLWIEHKNYLFSLVSVDAGGGLYRSDDNGATWTVLNTGVPITDILRVINSDGTNLYLGTSSGLFYSNDDGDTWNQGVFPDINTFSFLRPNFATVGNTVFYGFYGSGGHEGIYSSHDFGANWTKVSNFLVDEFVVDGDTLYAAGDFHEGTDYIPYLLSTVDFGQTWNTLIKDIFTRSIAVKDNKIFVSKLSLANSANSTVYFSGNYGANWIDISQGFLPNSFISSLHIAGNNVYATITGRSVWQRSLDDFLPPSQISSINGNSTPCTGSSQVYSVDSVGGVTYTWQFPTGWSITSGQGTHSVTVTSGANLGIVLVTPSNTFGTGTSQYIMVTPVTPGVSIAADNNQICQGSSVTFTATPVNGGTASYQWYVNGAISGTDTTVFSFSPADNDSVYVVMTSGLQCVTGSTAQSNGQKIEVTPVMPASVSITADTTSVCSGTAVNFTATPVNGGTPSYQWYVNGSAAGSDTNVFTYNPANGDAVKVSMSSSLACTSNNPAESNIVSMQVTPILNASVSIAANNNTVCSGSQVTLTATPINGGTPTYQWFVNGIAGGTNSDVFTYTPDNADQVNLTMTSSLACASNNPAHSDTVDFLVIPITNASVSIAADATSVCGGTAVNFTATPVNGGTPSYQWYVNGITAGTDADVFTYTPDNADQVSLTMTSSLACANNNPAHSDTIALMVTPLPNVSVSVTASSNPVCSGTSVTFTAHPVDGGTPVYQWYLNGSAVGTNASIYTYVPAEGDQVYVEMTSTLSCSNGVPVSSNVVILTLTNSVTTSVTIAANQNPYCAGSTVTLTATPGNGGASSYEWYQNGMLVGADTNVYSYVPTDGDQVYAKIVSDLVCAMGNPATSDTITLSENPVLPVSVSIGVDQNNICSGTSVTFTAIPVNGGAPAYQWMVNSVAKGINSNSYSYTPANNDVVKVQLTSDLQCTSGNPAMSNEVIMAVTETLPVSVAVAADKNGVCSGTTVTFTATPLNGGAPAYQWMVNGNVAGTNTDTYSYIPSNNDVVKVQLTSDLQCTSGNPAMSNEVIMAVTETLPVSVAVAADKNGVCSGTTVTFTATPLNGGASAYQWMVNGKVAGTNADTYSYTPANNDVVKVQLTSDLQCVIGNPALSNEVVMAVTETLPVSVTVAADKNDVCSGSTVTFTATPVNGGTPLYQWMVNGNVAGTDTDTYSYIPNNNDVVKVQLTSDLQCTSGNPALSNEVIMVVTETLPVSVSISADTNTVCSGSAITYTATPVNGGEPMYLWFVNGNIESSGTESYSYVPANGDQVQVEMLSSLTCVNNNPAQSNILDPIVLKNQPVLVNIYADNTSVCQGDQVTLTASPINGGEPSYSWRVNNIATGNSSDIFTYIPANGDKVQVEMTSSLACTSGNPALSNTVRLSVTENLPVSVSIATSDDKLCEGTSAYVTATTVNGGSGASDFLFEWFVNGEYILYNNYSYLFYTPNDGDKVSVKFKSGLTCTSGDPAFSDTIVIRVEANPTVTWVAANDTTYCADGGTVVLAGAQPEGGIYSGAGVVDGIFDPSVAGVGSHELVYYYETAFGCNGEAMVTVKVDSCTSISSVRFEDMVAVYPNPASDVLHIALNGGAAVKAVRLVSLLGNTVMEVKTAPAERMVELPLNGLNHTLYFIEIILEDGMLIKQVVVK